MRSHLAAAVVVATSLALVGCSTNQRAVDVQSDLVSLTKSGAVGAIATLDGGNTTMVLTSGVPNLTDGDSIGDNDRVRIGSVTQTFTAALVLQFVAEGKITLDAPVRQYLPNQLGSNAHADLVTVRQLLQPHSGLPEIDGEIPFADSNYLALGTLIEAVSGRSYSDELAARILEPLDLEDTYLPPAGEQDIRGDHLTGYKDLATGRTDVSRTEPSIAWSAGALVSTGKDLNTFWRALLSGRILPDKELAEMTAPQPGSTEADALDYGLGLHVTDLPCGVTYVGHSGGIRGYSTLSGATLDRAFTVTMTSTPKNPPDTIEILSHALCP
ncbi:serine hydrolase [Rhodococcus sp. ARC_M6]|uniref:serine hydrolase domain-containing protein n=1 Tax=Rhodococcus sp. ARC_M6 TaxID=2928852 RepID=UPI001FB38F9A|nr:serine hydrolase domain-containing protein [Rhodococcus sp. ARC_M6]MCJ0905278.1 beta-lactamase family protein [Rhodococcus sp. ARC_M6]